MNSTTITTTTTTETTTTVTYKDVPGYPGYRVGDDGSVWTQWVRGGGKGSGKGSHVIGAWRTLTPNTYGRYKMVTLAIDAKRQTFTVHKLVMLAFRGPCPEGLQVRHLDGVAANCVLTNLAYGTPTENQGDRVLHGTDNRGERHGLSKLTAPQVMEIRNRLAASETPESIAKDFGVCRQAITSIATRRTWKHVA